MIAGRLKNTFDFAKKETLRGNVKLEQIHVNACDHGDEACWTRCKLENCVS